VQLDDKEKELIHLHEKMRFLKEKLKKYENKNSIKTNILEGKSHSGSFINCERKELPNNNPNNIRKKKKNFYSNYSLITNNNLDSFYNKIKDNNRKENNKNIIKNRCSSTNNINNIDNYSKINKKVIISHNREGNMKENIRNYLGKIKNEYSNDKSRDSSYNKKYVSITHLNGNNELKLPININNNNYNMNKNNVLINLSTNIINDDINIEKLKIHQKLVEYRKLIDAKINKLMNDKQTSQKKKVIKSKEKENNNKVSTLKNLDMYQKRNLSSINSEHERKPCRKIQNISKTNYKYIDKEYYNNIKNTNIIIPRKINACYNESLNNGSSQDRYKMKQTKKNRINIISKNKDEKEDFNISNNEINNDNKQIFEQITSKGSNEKNDEEDTKK
jgi:hypothetical protein